MKERSILIYWYFMFTPGSRCKVCEERFTSLTDLKVHESSCKQPATCELCGQVAIIYISLSLTTEYYSPPLTPLFYLNILAAEIGLNLPNTGLAFKNKSIKTKMSFLVFFKEFFFSLFRKSGLQSMILIFREFTVLKLTHLINFLCDD